MSVYHSRVLTNVSFVIRDSGPIAVHSRTKSCVVTLSSNDSSDRQNTSTSERILLTRVSVNRQYVEFDVIGTSCFVLSMQNLKPEVMGIESRYAAG